MESIFVLVMQWLEIIHILLSVCIIVTLFKSSAELKLISVYLLIAIFVDVLSSKLAYAGYNNLFILHIYSLVEFILFSTIIFKLLKNRRQKQGILIAGVIGIILIILNTIFIQSLDQFNSYSAAFVSFSIILYCILYFSQLINLSDTTTVEMTVIKWIIIMLFIYHNINLIALFFSNSLLNLTEKSFMIIFFIRLIVTIITRSIILVQYGKLIQSFYLKPKMNE